MRDEPRARYRRVEVHGDERVRVVPHARARALEHVRDRALRLALLDRHVLRELDEEPRAPVRGLLEAGHVHYRTALAVARARRPRRGGRLVRIRVARRWTSGLLRGRFQAGPLPPLSPLSAGGGITSGVSCRCAIPAEQGRARRARSRRTGPIRGNMLLVKHAAGAHHKPRASSLRSSIRRRAHFDKRARRQNQPSFFSASMIALSSRAVPRPWFAAHATLPLLSTMTVARDVMPLSAS